MNVFDEFTDQPSAQQGAAQIKRMLQHAFRQVEMSLAQVHATVQQHGRGQIQSALGEDANQVVSLYSALRNLVIANKPGAAVEDLPS